MLSHIAQAMSRETVEVQYVLYKKYGPSRAASYKLLNMVLCASNKILDVLKGFHKNNCHITLYAIDWIIEFMANEMCILSKVQGNPGMIL